MFPKVAAFELPVILDHVHFFQHMKDGVHDGRNIAGPSVAWPVVNQNVQINRQGKAGPLALLEMYLLVG